MKLGILSYKPLGEDFTPEEYKLKAAALALGHEPLFLRAEECVCAPGLALADVDVLIPRFRVVEDLELHAVLLRAFEQQGVPLLNSSEAILKAKNKALTALLLNEKALAMPRTHLIQGLTTLGDAVDALGGFPLVLKRPLGTYGRGVYLLHSMPELEALVKELTGTFFGPLLLQEFVAEAAGEDRRLFVVGDRVVAAMKRQAQEGEFRSNVELGGIASAYEPSLEEIELAVAATQALGLEVAGVDLIHSERGPLILELNANPGFKALEEVTGIDVAKAIVGHAVCFRPA